MLVEGVLKGSESGNPRIWIGNDDKPRANFEMTGNIVRVLIWPEREIDGSDDEEDIAALF